MPARTLRLFPHEDPLAVAAARHRGFLITRLLAAGDGEDLRWLFGEIDRDRAVAALRHGAGRKLDRRSRAFWELVLDARSSPPAAAAESLWPGA